MSRQKILVAENLYDRSKKGRRLSLLIRTIASELAHTLNCQIELLFVQELQSELFRKTASINTEAAFTDLEKDIKELFRTKNIKSLVHLKRGKPSALLLKWLEENKDAQMLIMGTQGKRGLKKLLLGSVAEEIVRRSPIPVLVLGPEAQQLNTSYRFPKKSKILFLTDLNVSSTQAEIFTQKLANKLNASVTIFHSLGDHLFKARKVLTSTHQINKDIEKEFELALLKADRILKEKLKKWKDKGLRTKMILHSYPEPFEVSLDSELCKGYDLLAMGTHSRDAFLTAFLGSNARKAIQISSIPVIVIPQQHKDSWQE